ncbi:hypothetical protein PC123_g20558 [Phytophthora cactorum]|nr:hypothetical protein PC123_g20558 [Phytophthora cactorum]
MPPTDWRSSASEDSGYTFMLFHPDTQATAPYQQTQTPYATANMHPALCNTINQALSDEEILDEIFQEIMSPSPQDQELPVNSGLKGFDMASTCTLFNPVLSPTSALAVSAPSTPQLTSTLRRGSIPSASLGSISPNMAATLRVPAFPMSLTGSARNTAFFPMLNDPKVRVNTGFGVHNHTSMLFTSPTAGRRGYRRTNRPTRMQKKKPASRICRMPGCTKGIRSRGLCKAHGGDCNKNGQIKGLCRLHYSLTMAAKNSAAKAAAVAVPGMPMAMKLESQSSHSPCDTFELRV